MWEPEWVRQEHMGPICAKKLTLVQKIKFYSLKKCDLIYKVSEVFIN